jgi:hypothetical protein
VWQATFGSLPWRSRSQHDLAAKLCPAHNFVIWSRILQLFHRYEHHIETTFHVQYLGRYLEGQGNSMILQWNRVQPITLLFGVGFLNYLTEMITILRRCVGSNIWVTPWRSRSWHNLAANSCPAHKFVIWSWIFKLFHRNDHYIETCHAQHLGCYLEGQGHSMTLQQNCVRPITSLFAVLLYNYFTEMITIFRRRVTCNN